MSPFVDGDWISQTPLSLTVLITAFQEAETIGAAIKAIEPQCTPYNSEVIVICPDDATAQVAEEAGVRVLRDPQLGKPTALMLGLEAARGDLIVMTDGDVVIAPGALSALLAPFKESAVGAVSGRPISISPRTTMLGYWSHLLTDAGAHMERLRRDRNREFFVCSGYLYAIRNGLVKEIPTNALAEDAVVSHFIGEQGWQIRYMPDAEVFVKYPTSYPDWLRQKVRSAGGYAQPIIARSRLRMRSFLHEATGGVWRALAYAQSPREWIWTLLLFAARLHLWLLVLWRVRVQRTRLTELWQRVETTK